MSESTQLKTSKVRHPAHELVRRYGRVLRWAWQQRHALAGPPRLADESAFLPAALSLQETPVHPAPRRAMGLIVALLVIALVWSWFGRIDIVAVAPGQIVVDQRTKIVQSLQAAVVKAIHVRDGDRVTAGQLLVELDATEATADDLSVQQQLVAAELELKRANALLQALDQSTQGTTFSVEDADLTTGLDEPDSLLVKRAKDQLRAEWADIESQVVRLEADAASRQAETATARALLEKLMASLPLAQQREADFSSLVSQGFVSGHAQQDRKRERQELEADIATQKARVAEARSKLNQSRQARAAYLAETRRQLSDREAKSTVTVAQLRQDATKTQQRQALLSLTAPVSGTIQQLAIHTPGGVVTPAQALMVVVPDDSKLVAEVLISNKDVGFIRVGQMAEVKVETFNFTKYGTVPATVMRVSADAIPHDKLGPVFQATVALQTGSLQYEGKLMKLAPGMAVSAEVKTGRRRVIEIMFAPLQDTLSSAARER
jgi:hemolysin D